MKPAVIVLLVVAMTVAVHAQYGAPYDDGQNNYGIWSMLGGFLLLSVLAGRRRGTDYRIVYGNFTSGTVVTNR